MQNGQDGRAGRQRRRRREHVLGLFHQVGCDLGAAVGDVVRVVVAGLVVGGEFRAECGLDHCQLCRSGENRAQSPRQPDHDDAQQRA